MTRLAQQTSARRSNRRVNETFNYTNAIWDTADSICRSVKTVRHINMRQIAVDYVRCRNGEQHGTLATLTALREPNEGSRRIADADYDSSSASQASLRTHYTDMSGRSVGYLLTVYLPRFASLPYMEKLVTIAHELWHVSPACDGCLRSFPGRNRLHGNNARAFDRQAEDIIQDWIKTAPAQNLTDYLHYDLDQLAFHRGRIIGQQFSQSATKK